MLSTILIKRDHLQSRASVRFAWKSLVLFFGILVLGAGCAEDKSKPEEVLGLFLANLQYELRAKQTWDMLTEENQGILKERYEATHPGADPEPEQILLQAVSPVLIQKPENIVVISPIGNELKMRVSGAQGKSADFYLVRHNDTWKIDLLKSLGATENAD